MVGLGIFPLDNVLMSESSIECDRQNNVSNLHIRVCLVGGDVINPSAAKLFFDILTGELTALVFSLLLILEASCALCFERHTSSSLFIFLFIFIRPDCHVGR